MEALTWYDTLCLERISLGSSNPCFGSPAFELFSASLQSLSTKKLSRGTETVYKQQKAHAVRRVCVEKLWQDCLEAVSSGLFRLSSFRRLFFFHLVEKYNDIFYENISFKRRTSQSNKS